MLDIAPQLDAQSIPYAICPCVDLTEHGFGARDKVYFILAAMANTELRAYVAQQAGHEDLPTAEQFSFYHFTKSDALPPRQMSVQIIDPLYERVRNGSQRRSELT